MTSECEDAQRRDHKTHYLRSIARMSLYAAPSRALFEEMKKVKTVVHLMIPIPRDVAIEGVFDKLPSDKRLRDPTGWNLVAAVSDVVLRDMDMPCAKTYPKTFAWMEERDLEQQNKEFAAHPEMVVYGHKQLGKQLCVPIITSITETEIVFDEHAKGDKTLEYIVDLERDRTPRVRRPTYTRFERVKLGRARDDSSRWFNTFRFDKMLYASPDEDPECERFSLPIASLRSTIRGAYRERANVVDDQYGEEFS